MSLAAMLLNRTAKIMGSGFFSSAFVVFFAKKL
jgi:hypothetical protein